jgi:hypothetical protein
MKRAQPEHSLQRSVVELLHRVLPADAVFTAINPLPPKGAGFGARAKALGLAAGVPDILIAHRGFSLWLELKAPGGSLSDSQKLMHRALNQAYRCDPITKVGSVVVCKSLDEVLSALKSHRMMRVSAAA